MTLFTVRVPSLKRLVLHTSENRDRDDSDGFVINAPCLEYFNIIDHKGGFCVIDSLRMTCLMLLRHMLTLRIVILG